MSQTIITLNFQLDLWRMALSTGWALSSPGVGVWVLGFTVPYLVPCLYLDNLRLGSTFIPKEQCIDKSPPP